MGYFSNGNEGRSYETRWCDHCVHGFGTTNRMCSVMDAHMLYNYDDCNNDESILHILIPRTSNKLGNKRCMMFIEKETT